MTEETTISMCPYDTTYKWIIPSDPEWDKIAASAFMPDFYFGRRYTDLEAQRNDGEAAMLFVERHSEFIAIPLIIRSIGENTGSDAMDATSVYGYAGPISNYEAPSRGMISIFQDGMRAALQEKSVITLFSRLHPFQHQLAICQDLGKTVYHGETISLDLTLPSAQRRATYRKNMRRILKKYERELSVIVDDQFKHLHEFYLIYCETMNRVNAAALYKFNFEYFQRFVDEIDGVHLLFCEHQGVKISAGFFVRTGRLVQYHLGGTRTAYLKFSPMTFLFDTAGDLFTNSSDVLHLGGGRGGHADTLFHYKSGFSYRRHQYYTWRWILDPMAYERACRSKDHGAEGGYFPAYRGLV